MRGRAQSRLLKLLARRGIHDVAEWNILAGLLREGPADALNVTARVEAGMDDLARCLESGRVFRITAAEAEADRRRWVGDRDECVSDHPYATNHFDLTRAGAQLVEEIWTAALGPRLRRNLCGWRRRGPTEQVIVCARRATLERHLKRLRAYAESEGLAFECSKPRRVGSWWVHRQLRVKTGWRCEVKQWRPPTEASLRARAILDSHRVSVPEYWVLRTALLRRHLHDLPGNAAFAGQREPLGAFGTSEATAAVEGLTARRLLGKAPDFGVPFRHCVPGNPHLTRMGARLIILLEEKIAAAEGRTRFDGVIWKDGRGLLRAVRREDLEAAQASPRAHAPRHATYALAGPIRRGGAYRPHPYDLVRETWEMDLHCEWPKRHGEEATALDGLTEAEQYIFQSVHLLPSVDRHQLAGHARSCAGKGGHPEYAAALDALLARGLLKVLTQQECDADAARWMADDQNAFANDPYRPGCIAFTSEGYAIWKPETLSEERRFHERLVGDGCAVRFCRDPDRLRRSLEHGISDLEPMSGTRRIRHFTGPYPVSHCWIDRFTRLDSMWRADVEYEEV